MSTTVKQVTLEFTTPYQMTSALEAAFQADEGCHTHLALGLRLGLSPDEINEIVYRPTPDAIELNDVHPDWSWRLACALSERIWKEGEQ